MDDPIPLGRELGPELSPAEAEICNEVAEVGNGFFWTLTELLPKLEEWEPKSWWGNWLPKEPKTLMSQRQYSIPCYSFSEIKKDFIIPPRAPDEELFVWNVLEVWLLFWKGFDWPNKLFGAAAAAALSNKIKRHVIWEEVMYRIAIQNQEIYFIPWINRCTKLTETRESRRITACRNYWSILYATLKRILRIESRIWLALKRITDKVFKL